MGAEGREAGEKGVEVGGEGAEATGEWGEEGDRSQRDFKIREEAPDVVFPHTAHVGVGRVVVAKVVLGFWDSRFAEEAEIVGAEGGEAQGGDVN